MTAKDFITKIQAYYGPYREGQHEAIALYLSKVREMYLDILYDALLLGYSSQYKTTPDIAIFEEFRLKMRDEVDARRSIEETNGRLQIAESVVDDLDDSRARTIDALMTGLKQGKVATDQDHAERVEAQKRKLDVQAGVLSIKAEGGDDFDEF